MLNKLSYEDFGSVKELLVTAFMKDPLFLYLSDDAVKRRKLAGLILEIFFKYMNAEPEIHTPSEKKEGVAIWFNLNKKTKKKKINFLKLLVDLLKITNLFDVFRIFSFLFKVNSLPHNHVKKSDYYLLLLAVDPKYKGQGFASKLLKPMFKKFDKEGLTCCLETNNPVNVKIYEHFGFELFLETKLNELVSDFQMIRKPKRKGKVSVSKKKK